MDHYDQAGMTDWNVQKQNNYKLTILQITISVVHFEFKSKPRYKPEQFSLQFTALYNLRCGLPEKAPLSTFLSIRNKQQLLTTLTFFLFFFSSLNLNKMTSAGAAGRNPIIPLISEYDAASLKTVTLYRQWEDGADANARTIKRKKEIIMLGNEDSPEHVLRLVKDFLMVIPAGVLNLTTGVLRAEFFTQCLYGTLQSISNNKYLVRLAVAGLISGSGSCCNSSRSQGWLEAQSGASVGEIIVMVGLPHTSKPTAWSLTRAPS